MGTSLAAGHVTTLRMGWLMYLCIAMLIQVTAHPISSPPTNINLPVTESTAIHCYLNVLMQSYLFCQHVCLCWRNKIFIFCWHFVCILWMGDLFRFQLSPLWSCPFHISQFDFWNYHWKFVLYCQTENIKFPLWSHNSVSQAVKYQIQWGRARYKVWWLVINEEHSMTISGSKLLCSAFHCFLWTYLGLKSVEKGSEFQS